MTPRTRPSDQVVRVACVIAAAMCLSMPGLFMLAEAIAAPKGPNGQTCKSSGTTTVTGKEEGTGRAMTCTADFCKYTECKPEGGKIVCYEKTHYTNIRNCKPAASGTVPKLSIPRSSTVPGPLAPPTQGLSKELTR